MNVYSNRAYAEDVNLQALIELAIILGQFNDYDETLQFVSAKAKSLCKADVARIMMVNPRTRQTIKTIFTQENKFGASGLHLLHTNLSGWTLKNRRAFLSSDLQRDLRFDKKIFYKLPTTSAMCIPIKAEGIIFGTFLVCRMREKSPFTEKDLVYFEALAAVTSPFLHNIKKMQSYFSTKLPLDSMLKKYRALGLLGSSKKFIELLKTIEAAALCDVRVLLVGPSGTGKELVAKAIHKLSQRGDKKLVALDCGAIPSNLIESELFGHVKGAFTGAHINRKGLFEEAEGGTLFMDEIANLPLDMQAKLLRTLQEGEIRPLGSNTTKPVNVRIITACSSPLEKLVENHQFREDLFYRLNVFPIEIPTLEQRQEDIPLLIEHYIKLFANQQQKQVTQFSEELIDFFKRRRWTGNIRELENMVERIVTLAGGETKTITASNLPQTYKNEWQDLKKSHFMNNSQKGLTETLASVERRLIIETLSSVNWNQSQAARVLQISEQTIRYKMAKLDIYKPQN